MADETVRRSMRDNQGTLPARFDDYVMGGAQANQPLRDPPADGSGDQVTEENAEVVQVELAPGRPPLDDDTGSVRSGVSTASSLRRRQREAELRAAEEVARLETEQERLRIQQLEREKTLVQLRKEVELEDIEDELEEFGGNNRLSDIFTTHKMDAEFGKGPKVAARTWSTHTYEVPNRSAKVSSGGDSQLVSSGSDSQLERLAGILCSALKPEKRNDDNHYQARQTVGKVKLPEFHGDPSEWPLFIAQFTSSTEECKFTPAENLIRLREAVKGKAKESIQALLVCPENLKEIMETLETNFGRKDQIIRNLIDKARKVMPPKDDDYNSILTFSNTVVNMCATMKTLKSTAHLQNPQLLQELVDKLSTTMRFDWAKTLAEKDEVNLEDFANWVKRITRVLGIGGYSPVDLKPKKKENAFQITEEQINSDNSCSMCHIDGHTIQKCRKFRKLTYDKKQKLVIEKRLCFGCLEDGHRFRDCPVKQKCGVQGCDKYHNALIHKYKERQGAASDSEKSEEGFHVGGSSAHLPYVPVILSGPAGEIQTFAFLDEGSTSTFIDVEVAKKLGLEGQVDPITVNMFQNKHVVLEESERVTFRIRGAYPNARENVIKGARTIDDIGASSQSLNFQKLEKKYGYLDGLPIVSYKNVKPMVLVGQPDKLLSLARKSIHRGSRDPVAYKTWLGWTICGKYRNENCNESLHMVQEDDELHKHSFTLEAIGVKVSSERPKSQEDKRAEALMEKTTKRIGDEFETGLLWKNDGVRMPKSYSNALSRLCGQEKKMYKDHLFAAALTNKLEDLKTIEKVEIPRCYSLQIPVALSVQLHIFNDTSAKAYATIAFLRVKGVEGVDVAPVAVKTRAAPLKEVSMPRTELQSAVMLSPYLDDKGVIRMKGRLQNAMFVPVETRNPIIMDSRHHLSQLLIMDHHVKCGHHGIGIVCNLIREKYWITGLKSAVKKVTFNCKNRRAKPTVPEMEDLPTARITSFVKPFAFTRMDAFGPFDVVVKRSTVKRYGLLFTCLSTRAVHIEKLDSLTTDSCIMAIDRMSAVRGRPEEIFYGNGSYFREAERELARYLEEETIQKKMLVRGIKFNFNPPAAPHFGGVWERPVRSIKTAMGATLKLRKMIDEVLITTFQQAANLVNSRPVTEISVDPGEPVALTPNHLLFGPNFRMNNACEMEFADGDLKLRKQWRFAQRLADHFWSRWIKEYLPTLLKRTKWHEPQKEVKVWDICIIVDTNLPRDSWMMGRITDVHPGADGKVRVVDVMVRGKVYRRPVAKIAVLDVKKDD